MNAAAPIKLGNTKGMGRMIFHILFPGRSHLVVNHASRIPITAVVKETETASIKERCRGDKT